MSQSPVIPFRGAAKGGCPVCGRPAVTDYRPFCSRRCADVDLNRWLSEGYRVPTEDAPGDGESGDEAEQGRP